MPRINRKYYISSFLHIMVQGINKEAIFKSDFYKNLYISLLRKYINEKGLKLLAYVIMDNHAHVLLKYSKIEDVSYVMHKVNQFFAQAYNKYENRVGYVFRGRYRCEQIKDRSHLYNVFAYIHFNPVKANLVRKISDYKFSSYNEYSNGDIGQEEIYMIFDTYDYKEIFNILHERYLENYLRKQKKIRKYEDVINEFKCKNKIHSTELIVKENNLLIELIFDLENNTNLTDKEIARILKIGKNKICNLKKRL